MIDDNNATMGGEVSPSPDEKSDDRPSSPKVIGILLIVCGSLMVLYGIFGGIATLAMSQMGGFMGSFGNMASQPGGDIFVKMLEEMKPLYMIQGFWKIIEGLISVLALIAGILLVQYRESGRKLSIIWGAVALVYLGIDFIIYFTYILPTSSRMMEAMMQNIQNMQGAPTQPMPSFSGLTSTMGTAGIVFVNLIMAALPIVAIALMTRRTAKESCS